MVTGVDVKFGKNGISNWVFVMILERYSDATEK